MASFLRRIGLGRPDKRRPSLEAINMDDGPDEAEDTTLSGACEALMLVPGGDYAPGTDVIDFNDYTDDEDPPLKGDPDDSYEFDRPPMEYTGSTAMAQSYDERHMAQSADYGSFPMPTPPPPDGSMAQSTGYGSFPMPTPAPPDGSMAQSTGYGSFPMPAPPPPMEESMGYYGQTRRAIVNDSPEFPPKMAQRWRPQTVDYPASLGSGDRSSAYHTPKSRDISSDYNSNEMSDKQRTPIKKRRVLSPSDAGTDYSVDFSDEEYDVKGPARLASSERFDSPDETSSIRDEKYKIQAPETMQETMMTDSEDEGAEDTTLDDSSILPGSSDMKFLNDDSIGTPVLHERHIQREEEEREEARREAQHERDIQREEEEREEARREAQHERDIQREEEERRAYESRRREYEEMLMSLSLQRANESQRREYEEMEEARREAQEAEERARRQGMRDLEPDECALLGALPRQIPKKKAQVEDLEAELLRLRDQVERVVNVITPTSHSQPPPLLGAVRGQDAADGTRHPPHSNIVNPGYEEIPPDVEAIKQRIAEIENRRAILKEQADLEQARLAQLRQKAECHPKVKHALGIYRRERDKFLDSLFNSAQLGKLGDVAIQTAVLDIVGRSDLENLIHKHSKLPLIHLALIQGREDIVKFLLQHSGKNIAKAPAKTEECPNLTPLYIAMQYSSYDKVKILVDTVPEEENERAKYINQLVPNKAYEGTPYNELPLAGSVWSSVGKGDQTQLQKMLEYLVDNGADFELATSTGDTLLHLLVLQAVESIDHLEYIRTFLKTTFTKAVGKWWKRRERSDGKEMKEEVAEWHGIKYLMAVTNNDILSPLTLAAKVESPLYSDLVNWEKVMRFPDQKTGQEFSNVDTFNITDITSLRQSGKGFKYNQFSVMHVLAHNDVDLSQKEWKVDIACLEPLKSVIKHKWSVYQWIFYLWGIFHLIHMITFTALTFHYKGNLTEMSKNASNETGDEKYEAVTVITPGIPFFAFFLFLPVVYLVAEVMDFCLTGDKFELHLSLIGNGIYRFLAGLFSMFTIVWFILHMTQFVNQDIMLSMAILFGWLFCIFFTRTISFPGRNSQIGAFSIMVQRMLFHDLIAFIVLSFFILVAFSGAMHALMLYSKDNSTELIFGDTFFDMLKYYSALDDEQGYDSTRVVQLGKFLLTVYGIISVVLLINMLIAAMNKTYDLIRETRIDLVMRQKLSIMLLMERRLPFVRGMAEKHFNRVTNRRQQTIEVFIKVVSKKSIASLLKRSK